MVQHGGSHNFCVRIDYVNAEGEQHHMMLYGTEAVHGSDDVSKRIAAFRNAFKLLGREIMLIQRFESVSNVLVSTEPSQAPQAPIRHLQLVR